ncbi:hypothetical protein C7974DRAFT_36034 [Boeremia exigua]|uniref:uncharacterized protein n=1 Tax=Boeremia exigua TaxID=749465 RepID=UPI001E8CB705|nr:uncharacterized protein C7974DRAFT_36034 [Boeremia exigua]KAH6618728.1 hypothetical protein C7974DRAFT_36034 [Boeremia exigua]
MKRQHSSNNKSILHFFKGVPRTAQESPPATANTSTDHVSQPPPSAGPVLPASVPSSTASASAFLTSTASTIADAPATDSVMTSIETPPNTSQISANSGASKRVLSHGQQVVLNSDSDSDSLGDLDFGLPAPKPKTPTQPSRPSRRTGFDAPELRRPPKSARNNGARSFNQLMETTQKNLVTERKIQEGKAHLDKVDEHPALLPANLDKETLKHAIQDSDDSDHAGRLLKAMQRTNETQAQTAYHFFEDTPSMLLPTPFPEQILPAHAWTTCFKEPSTRDQAFLTGFAQQIFRLQALPKELAIWMIDQICLDPREALDQRYIEILMTHDEQLQKQLSPKKLDFMFTSLGAHIDSLNDNAEISPSELHAHSEQALPPALKRIAILLTSAAPWLHSRARIHAFYLLCHTCLDDRVLHDPDILNLVQDAIEAVICQYADNCKLISGVGSPLPDDLHSLITSQLTHTIPKLLSRVTNPLLQANLIHAFPTRSPLTAYLQRHLALSFLLHPLPVNIPLADPQLPVLIHKYLGTSSHWRMSKDTNHGFVTARITLLDIAIGPGPMTVPYLPLLSPPPSEAGSSPPLAPTPASSEVKKFNKEVDALAQHAKILGNSIIETGGALDLTALEAKERCERLFWRLQHAVRVGGMRAENVFGDSDDEKQLKVRKFFKPLSKKIVPTESVFDEKGDTGLSM